MTSLMLVDREWKDRISFSAYLYFTSFAIGISELYRRNGRTVIHLWFGPIYVTFEHETQRAYDKTVKLWEEYVKFRDSK